MPDITSFAGWAWCLTIISSWELGGWVYTSLKGRWCDRRLAQSTCDLCGDYIRDAGEAGYVRRGWNTRLAVHTACLTPGKIRTLRSMLDSDGTRRITVSVSRRMPAGLAKEEVDSGG